MRKDYVKPTMESEAFVANEYVAACYWVDCTHDGCIDPIKVRDVNSVTAALNKFANTYGGKVSTTPIDGSYIYKGTLNRNNGLNNDTHNNDNWGDYEWLRKFINWLLGVEEGEDIGYHHDLSVWQTTAANDNGHTNASC